MILANTVSETTTLNGVSSTVAGPADQRAPQGYSPLSLGGMWQAAPGIGVAIKALGTASGTIYVDWTLGGYFTLTASASAWTISFNASSTSSGTTAQVGQIIFIQIATAAGALTMPTTFTWLTGSSGTQPAFTSKTGLIAVLCTATGSAPTYTGWLVAQQS